MSLYTIVNLHKNTDTYQTTHHPPQKLKAFISEFTVYHFTGSHPVMLNPGGYFELIFQLDGSFKQSVVTEQKWQLRPDFFIGGLHNRSFLVKPGKAGARLISVNFKPNCARYFIPDKLNLFKNRIAALEDIFRRKTIGSLSEDTRSRSISQIITLIESFLINNYRERPASPVDLALAQIYRDRGFVHIGQLSQQACLSPSHLRKRFNEEIGMSPKEYSKIVRVNHINNILARSPGAHLTELTYRLGYFDQAHFIHDFKSVTGLSPKHFLQ